MIKQLLAFAGEYRIAGVKTFAGRNGVGWSGQLFRGANFIGFVGDDCDGGPVRIDVKNGHEMNALNAHAYTKMSAQHERTEGFIDELVNYQAQVKKLQSLAKKKILLSSGDDTVDAHGVPTAFAQLTAQDTPAVRAKIAAKYPDRQILNDEVNSFTIPRASSKTRF